MKKAGLVFFLCFFFISCSKDETMTSSSTNESHWTLSSLKMRSSEDVLQWTDVPNSDQIKETIVLYETAQAMVRTLSDSSCQLIITYNMSWEDEIVFSGYSIDSNPRGCSPIVLFCPSSYSAMALGVFEYGGEFSDDEKTLFITCSPGPGKPQYRYTFARD